MVNYESFYEGANYGFDAEYGLRGGTGSGVGGSYTGHRIPASQIGFPTDPTTANQLQKVSEKIATGTKVIEVSGLGIAGGGGAMSHLDKIPKQHFDEIRRLKKLAGAELTFHGPLVEPTGVSRQGWDETQRVEAQRQMTEAVTRAHDLDPNGNIIVTFHASNGLPNPEQVIYNEKAKDGREVTRMFFVDEREGRFIEIGPAKKDYFKKDPKTQIIEEVDAQLKEGWARELQHANFNAHNGLASVQGALGEGRGVGKEGEEVFLKYYKEYIKDPKKAEEIINPLDSSQREIVRNKMRDLTHGDIYLRDAYINLKNLFNQAYEAVEKNKNKDEKAMKDFHAMEDYRKKLVPQLNNLGQDPSKLKEFGEELYKGIELLRSIDPPKRYTQLKEFGIEKAAETFSGVAISSYKKFKDSSPIISIENPPYGSGLSSGEDMRDLVKASREKFVEKATKQLGMSEGEAKKQAEKLIGVTWDVGHINMLRGHGFEEKHLIESTKKVAPFVKHVHLSDNFGTEHTELPMGMGNVPMKKHLELIDQYNQKVKKIVETGDWFSRQGGLGMVKTPADISFSALGSPVYSMKMAPYWNQFHGITGAYNAGFGATNPQVHHTIYGAGFSGLPVELGGQIAGQSRFSGSPTD